MHRFTLPLLALLSILCAGCFFSAPPAPAPVYTLADPPATPIAQNILPAVRLAADLRAAPGPLHFHPDGTVTPVKGLTYYAPLELALEVALRDATALDPELAPRRLPITVLAFCRDDRSGTPLAVVRLATPAPNGAPRELLATRPLPVNPSPRELREALASALLDAYAQLTR